MSQRKKSQKQGSNRMVLLIITAVLVAVAGYFVWTQTQGGSGSTAGTVERIAPQQYQDDFAAAAKPHILVDVRTPEEFASGHIAGSVNIPLQSLEQRMNEIPQDQPVVLYCRSGNRSNTAAQMLARAGYSDIYDLGGVIAWQAQGLALQTAR